MDPRDDALFRESGERLAICMAVSAVLSELAGADEKKLKNIHALLSEIVEAQLAQVPEDEGSTATREMFGHATAALDRIFGMAAKLRGVAKPLPLDRF